MDDVINIVEDVKTKISDDEYMRLMNALMEVHKHNQSVLETADTIRRRNRRLIRDNNMLTRRFQTLENQYNRLKSKYSDSNWERAEVNEWIDKAHDEFNKWIDKAHEEFNRLRFIVDEETSDEEVKY
jgi:predicted nuclease with TOPRIM domain